MLISGGKVIAIDEINHDNTLSGDGLFNPLGVNIDAIGKPLTYSGSKSVADINELDNIKVGTVYTISGEPGTITAGNFDVIQGDEIAWGGDPAQWFNIGKDKVDSWKIWSEDHNSSGDNNSVYIGKDLTSENGGFIIGDVGVDTDLEGFNPELTKANNGLVITKAFKDIPESAYEQYGLSPEYMKSSSGALNFGYNEIEYNSATDTFDNKEIIDNTKWAASATNGGIAIGRAVTADFGGIAISPKFNKFNQNHNVIGTSASNEGIAIGEGVAATNGGLALGKNGLSASNAAVGIGRIGTANNASVLLSNDLRQAYATTGNTYCYYDTTEQKYRPVDKKLQQHYYHPQNVSQKKYNPNTSAFETITGAYTCQTFTKGDNIKYILFNEYDGQIIFVYGGGYSSDVVSGYYDENLRFHKVNKSDVPSTATFVSSYSATISNSWTQIGSGSIVNPTLFTTSFNIYYDNFGYTICYDDSNYTNLKFYEYFKYNNIYNYLKTKPLLSGFIDPDSMSGKVYYGAYYDDNTKSPTSGEIIAENQYIDYLENDHGQKIYIEDIVLTSVSAKFEPVTLANYNGIGIGQNFNSEHSILLNTNGNSYLGHIESYSAWSYRYGTALSSTGSKTSNVFKENTFFTNGIIHSSATQPTAQGESILLSPNGKNVYAYGESLLLGRVDTTAIGRSIAIGNRQSACQASLAIGYADENDGSNGLYSAMCNSALNKSMSIGILNFAVNYSIAFGRYNSAYQDGFSIGKYNYTYGNTYAFGERNYISTGKSILVGYENSAMGSFEGSIFGFRNYLNGGSVQVSLLGYHNSASCGNIQGIIGGNSNTAVGSNYQTVILGTDNYCSVGSMQGIELGCKNRISCGSVRGTVIGVENSASMSTYDGVLIGNCNTANYSDTQAVIIGNSNSGAIQQGVLLGQNNSAFGNPILVGYSNKNSYPSRDIMYGYYNLAEGESFVFGNYNNATTGGHNLALGISNTASNESIGIGRYNAIKGHGIAIGWYNQGSAGNYYNHSILMGYSNSSNNTRQDLTYKNVDIYNLIQYPQETVDEITTRYQTARTNARTNSAVLFSVYVYNINRNSEYIDIAPPLYTYDSTYNVISPYDYYDEKSYIILPYSAISDVQNAYNRGDMPEEVAARYKFINDTTRWNNIINLINNRATLLPIYTEYSAASSQYHELTSTNNSYTATENSISTETNSLVVGSNNSASHHNSYLFGSYNQSFSSLINSDSDDGFVYAFGLGNIVCRNYDMAIGYGSVASGGENIAIGTKQNYYSPIQNAKAIGYRNISIYSEVEGISNFAYNSKIVSDYGDEYNYNIKRYTNNIIYHSNISGLSGVHKNFIFGCYSGYNNEYPGIIELRYTDNSFILDSNNISYLSAHHSFIFGNNYYSTDKPILRSQFDYTLFGFGQNKAIKLSAANAIIGGGNGEYTNSNISNAVVWNSRADYSTVSNSLIIGTNVNYGDNGGSIIVSDPSYSWSTSDSYINVVENQHKSIIIGDNKLLGNNYNYLNFVLGDGNSINSNTNYYKNFIMGSTNQLTGNHYFNNNSIFGDENIIGTASFTHVYGTKNIVESGGYNTIFGLNNKLGNSAYQIYSADSNQIRQNSYTNSSVRLELSNSERAYGIVLATTKEIYGYSATYETYKPFFVYQYRDNARDTWHDRDRDYTGNWYKLHSFSNAGIVNGWGLNNHLVLTDKAAANDNFYFTIEYLSWWSYGSSRYLYDMITYEMYDNLPDTGKALYSNTLTSGGVSFRYRSLNWRDDTACDCTKNIYKLVRIPYNGVKLQHIEIIPLSTITSATDGSQLDSVAVTSQNSDFDNGPLMFMDCSHNELTGTYTRTLTAKLGISSHFNNKSYLKSDTEYPYVWNVYYPDNYRICTESNFVFGKDNIFTEYTPTGEFDNEYNEYRHNNVIGSHNILNSNEIFFTTVIGQNNNINASGYVTNSFIYGTNNNLVTKPGSPVSSTFGFIYGQNNIQIDGVQAVSFGSDTTAYGDLSMVFGDFTMAKKHQFVIGKFNDYNSTPGVERENYSINYEIGYYDSNYHYYSDVITYDSTLSAYTAAPQYFDRKDINSGVLFSIGNGYMDIYDPNTNIVNISSISYNTISLDTNKAYKRRNAMIVSADGTVSAKRFIEADPALTITGGDFVTVTENQQNNLLTIDLETSLGQMITELSGVLTAKPSTGRHILGVDNGTLTWLEVNQ